MVRTHKPSSWQPAVWRLDNQLEEEVKKCYPPPVMEKIIQAARLEKIEPDSVKQTKLAKMIEHDIIFLGGFTKNWLKLKNRPTPAQRKTALKKIEKATHTLNGILKTLDGDSTDDLRKAMLSDPFSRQALGTDPEVYPGHRTRGHAQFQTLFVLSTN